MRPDDNQLQPQQPRGAVTPPVRDYQAHHDAAADITRNQLDSIYSDQAAIEAQNESSDPATPAYDRTQQNSHQIDASQWQRYHSSWQDYYQKYYERYYVGAVHQVHSAYSQHIESLKQDDTETKQPVEQSIGPAEATEELRGKLRSTVSKRARSFRKSRHFIPILSALVVVLVVGFVQYNSAIIAYAAAYIAPGNVEAQNIIVDPNESLSVDPAPRLIIPKINVDIAVNYDAKTDHDSQMAAMRDGVAYFGINGANSKPGQKGNVPIAGHSSNDFTDTGNAKFIFARLEQLVVGDTFYLNYNGTRYTYTVTKTSVVAPTQINALQIGNEKPYATLITCTPLGTAEKRFLVFAEQISPSPSSADGAPEASSTTEDVELTGKSPTAIERLFGAQ